MHAHFRLWRAQTSFDEETAPSSALEEALPPELSTGDDRVDAAVRSMVARESALSAQRLAFVRHHVEHEMATVHDNIKATLKKLTEQEADNKRRIEQLESQLSAKVRRVTSATARGACI
jgi:septal ring factor EnvC (AmiA/AmiB activator)